MAIEPPPNIMTPGKIRGKIRTGAKTATKDQERDYLARFQAIAEDPSPLLPEWRGSGPDPFARMRRRLARIQSKQSSEAWLKWYARGRKLSNAYASTLLVLKGGKIPSFASLKFQGRDVKYVLRGNGQRDKLISVQNHEDPQVRLLGFLDAVKRHRVVLVSNDEAFFATRPGATLPPENIAGFLTARDVEASPLEGEVRCPHAGTGRLEMRYEVPDIAGRIRLCRSCVERVGGTFEALLERNILGPGGKLRIDRRPTGRPFRVEPPTAEPELDRLVDAASQDALDKSKDYEQVTDVDLLDWTQEALFKRLDGRSEGYLLAGEDLWLTSFDEAARRFGASAMEQRALAAAFLIAPPRLRTSDPSVTKLLSPLWKDKGAEILRAVARTELPEEDLRELAQKAPADALPALTRREQTHERFRDFPRFEKLPPPLQLAHDLFKARRTEDPSLFQSRLATGVQAAETRSLALALARVFNAAAGLEWQYAPHEKDEAKFLEPFARDVSLSAPASLEESLANLAQALNIAPPRRVP